MIYDSRGYPTVEADVYTSQGRFRASVPSGKSTGEREACELRDGGDKWNGKGTTKAVANINTIIGPAVLGMDATDQKAVDAKMIEVDGTKNKNKLGGNAILAVSMAVSRAGAAAKDVPLYQHIADLAGNKQPVLPVPCFNVINGGVHAGNALPFQEFMILPVGAPSFSEGIRIASETFHVLHDIIKKQYGLAACNVGDEGGFAPNVSTPVEALDLIVAAIDKAGYTGKIVIGLDSASSEIWDNSVKKYDMNFKVEPGKQLLSGEEFVGTFVGLLDKYPIVFLEDPFDENDWETFAQITALNRVPIIGDDLLCTNPESVSEAITKKSCSGLLLKVNQIGTLTEATEAVRRAKAAGWTVMTSHRSGETEDTWTADVAVGLSTGLLKDGAPCRSERLAKYNELLRIEEALGDKATYAAQTWKHIAW